MPQVPSSNMPPAEPQFWNIGGISVSLRSMGIIRRAMQIQLTENQTWYGEIIDCQGYSLFGMFVYNYSTSPAALAEALMQFSPNSDFSTPPYNAYQVVGTPAAGSAAIISQPSVIQGRYARPKIRSGSTAGTYTIAVYCTFTP